MRRDPPKRKIKLSQAIHVFADLPSKCWVGQGMRRLDTTKGLQLAERPSPLSGDTNSFGAFRYDTWPTGHRDDKQTDGQHPRKIRPDFHSANVCRAAEGFEEFPLLFLLSAMFLHGRLSTEKRNLKNQLRKGTHSRICTCNYLTYAFATLNMFLAMTVENE